MSTHEAGRDRGFTLIELLIVVTLIGILATLSAPFILAAKASANEASAIGSMRALNSAQTAYSASCGSSAYAPTFAVLVNGRFASPDMDVSPKSGFQFVLNIGTGAVLPIPDCQGGPRQTAYYAAATPLSTASGKRSFATNPAGVVWEAPGGVAPAEPFVIGGGVHPVQQ